MKLNWAIKLLFSKVAIGIAWWHSSKMQFAGGIFRLETILPFSPGPKSLEIWQTKTLGQESSKKHHHYRPVPNLSSPFCSSWKHRHHYAHHHYADHHGQRGKTPAASLGDGSGHMTLPRCRFLTDCQRIFNQPMLIFNQLPDASQLMLVYAKSSQSIPPKSLCQDCTLSVSSDFDFELNLRCDPY